jgi:hypothetical protein
MRHEADRYRSACQISGITPDEVTSKFIPAISSAVHMGNIQAIELVQGNQGWSIVLRAMPGSCATQIADYLFQTD